MNFTTGHALLELCRENGISIARAMLLREVEVAEVEASAAFARMRDDYDIMKRSATKALSENLITAGGLIGGQARMLQNHRDEGKAICGGVLSRAITYAMSVLEVNASMGLIVAAPTAGASGVIPGVFMALQEEFRLSDDDMAYALFNAGAVGYLITRNATVSGAQGGCQAEVGAASAMAASAAVQLMEGTPAMCLDAAAIAIANQLGLVCDPVAGLVESPCQTRNAAGAANALTAAELALSGVTSLIPFDEMVEAMYKVGRSLPFELRETALGGCAGTPTGKRCRHLCG